jgi:hypothetical protein
MQSHLVFLHTTKLEEVNEMNINGYPTNSPGISRTLHTQNLHYLPPLHQSGVQQAMCIKKSLKGRINLADIS